MAATDVALAATRIAMVWPRRVAVGDWIVGLRATPSDDAELVDQAHVGEVLRVLGERGGWLYVQGEDQYFGWVRKDAVSIMKEPDESRRLAAVILTPVRSAPDRAAEIVGHVPGGSVVPAISDDDGNGWIPLQWNGGGRTRDGYVAVVDTDRIADLPQRPPSAEDLLRTAKAFIGVTYLWGGTTAHGLDCSGLVQQVYRLNGVALPRDADQQATLGRPVDDAQAGDLLFFGADAVTHVALATGATAFIHAPEKGGSVVQSQLGGDRKLRSIRRYLPGVSGVSGR